MAFSPEHSRTATRPRIMISRSHLGTEEPQDGQTTNVHLTVSRIA